ncbi:MAG: hypothetical protein R3253_15590, partial [Longimicrobiales bacterium]|nr:hypothetical protein [Longimicrobiales bacterium]
MSFRSAVVAAVALLALAGPTHAQELVDPPGVLLKGVPFDVTVMGAPDVPSAWVEVRGADGALLGSGTVEAYGSTVIRELVVASSDQLPLLVRVGDAELEHDATVTAGWYSL